jgi:hypothetical protein
MKNIILLPLLTLSVNLYGQCGSVYKYGVEYKIPCDFDYKTHIQDSLELQEKLFVEYVNKEREAACLPPFEYFKDMEVEVSDKICKVMVQKELVYHPGLSLSRSYYWVECVNGVYWGYTDTDIALDSYVLFKNSVMGHWEHFMDPYHKKISVSFLPSKNKTEKNNGLVYVVVAFSN